jgi:cell wall-associated NlpC family hydrolase
MSDAETQIQAGAVTSGFMGSIHLDERETVFAVQCLAGEGKVTLTGKTSDQSLKQALLDKMAAIRGVSVVDQVVVLPAASLGDRTYGIVKLPVINLGDGPGSAGGSHTVTQARMGDVLRLLDLTDGWYLAQMDDSYLGWVDPEDIFAIAKAELDSFWSGRVALVSAKTAESLTSPGGERAFRTDLVQGSVLPIAGVKGQWTTLKVPGGGEVWVKSSQVKEFAQVKDVFAEKKGAEGVIATACQYVGLPYLWGGTTVLGFDCSGLTQFAFKMNGYRLRRDADLQYEQGEPVADRKSLQPGDLVFFQTYRQGASHVGIYVGDSRYIQAGSSGLSMLSFNPADPDYSANLDKAYLGARRIIK